MKGDGNNVYSEVNKQSGSSTTKNSMEDFYLFFKNNIYLFAVVDLCRGIWDPQSSLQPA